MSWAACSISTQWQTRLFYQILDYTGKRFSACHFFPITSECNGTIGEHTCRICKGQSSLSFYRRSGKTGESSGGRICPSSSSSALFMSLYYQTMKLLPPLKSSSSWLWRSFQSFLALIVWCHMTFTEYELIVVFCCSSLIERLIVNLLLNSMYLLCFPHHLLIPSAWTCCQWVQQQQQLICCCGASQWVLVTGSTVNTSQWFQK